MTASSLRGVARNGLRGQWGIAVLVTVVASILGASSFGGNSSYSAGSSTVSSATGSSTAVNSLLDSVSDDVKLAVLAVVGIAITLSLIYLTIVLVIGGAVNLGLKQFNIALVKKDAPASFGLLFSRFNIFGKAFVLQVLLFVFIALWTLLFVIPGIIASYRYAMAPYLMSQNPEMGALEAINRSKEMMKGQKWKLFCLHISFIGWLILGTLTCGIGLLWVAPYMGAAEAGFYLNLTNQLPVANQ